MPVGAVIAVVVASWLTFCDTAAVGPLLMKSLVESAMKVAVIL